jgi:hypothetical protein
MSISAQKKVTEEIKRRRIPYRDERAAPQLLLALTRHHMMIRFGLPKSQKGGHAHVDI